MNKNIKVAKELVKLAKELISKMDFPYLQREDGGYEHWEYVPGPNLKFDIYIEEIPMKNDRLKELLGGDDIYAILQGDDVCTFNVNTDNYDDFEVNDYGVLKNPHQIKKGDITFQSFQSNNTIDFTQLNEKDQKEIMSQLIYFVDNFMDAGKRQETQLDNWYLEALEDWQNAQIGEPWEQDDY